MRFSGETGIVFFSLLGQSTGLWQVAASGGAPEQLSVFVRGPATPTFDRQGRLGYVHQVREVNIWRSEVSEARGRPHNAPAAKLVPFTRFQESPQFSPDGKRIAFRVASDRSEIWLCNSDGQHPAQLPINLPGDIPRWSPDGQQIAFQSSVAGNMDIYVSSVAGGQPRRLTTEAANDEWPSWSHDGGWIYFGSNRSGNWQIWKAPAAGGRAVQVTRNGGHEAFESPDGRSVYYAKSYGLLGIWRIPVVGGVEERVLEQGSQGYWGITDKGIYFADPESRPKPTVHFFSFATRQLKQLATLEKSLLQVGSGSFAVSPDGRWILCTQLDRADSDIMLVENFH
jgi:dipeptidyl aminopeptidase/acylaminoacyl peptidase